MQIILCLTSQASPDATTELPDDPDAAARGRNGWFCPRQITIRRGEQVWVAVRSRRMGENAPIQLQIAAATAHALGGALLLAAANSVTRRPTCARSRRSRMARDYAGGDFDDTGELTVVEVPVSPDAYVTDELVNAAFRQATGQDPIHVIRWVEVEEPVGGYACSVCRADIAFDPLDLHDCAHCGEPICPACAARSRCVPRVRAVKEACHAQPDPPTAERRPARRGADLPLRPAGGAGRSSCASAPTGWRSWRRTCIPTHWRCSTCTTRRLPTWTPGRAAARPNPIGLPDHHPHARPDRGCPGARALLRRSHRGGLRSRRDGVAERNRCLRRQLRLLAGRLPAGGAGGPRPRRHGVPHLHRGRDQVPTGTRPIPATLARWPVATSSTSAT